MTTQPEETTAKLRTLAQVEAAARRQAKKAVTDLAEGVDDALRAGATLDDIRLWTGWNLGDLERMLADEASRVYNRRYNRERWRRIKAGEMEPAHGSSEGVAVGCTCDKCEALRQSRRDQAEGRKREGLPPGDPRHGTPSARWHYGCTCELCTAANVAAYQTTERLRRRRQRRAELPPDELAELRRKDAERKRADRATPLIDGQH